jgi:4'-phosphopantetheinyl transferase EntD
MASMTVTVDILLRSAIDTLALPGILVGHRLISPGDEYALMPDEASAFAASVVKVRRASGAARIVARELLGELGFAPCAVPKAPSRAPIWPAGIVGSLAHDPRIAVAAVARADQFAGLGIDVEPAEALPVDLVTMVATPRERLAIADDPLGGRILFAAKEAVYKAVYPIDETSLEHHDVEVALADRKATVRNSRVVEIRYCVSTHIVVLAFLSGARSGPTDQAA